MRDFAGELDDTIVDDESDLDLSILEEVEKAIDEDMKKEAKMISDQLPSVPVEEVHEVPIPVKELVEELVE